jgi:hypothetical protein
VGQKRGGTGVSEDALLKNPGFTELRTKLLKDEKSGNFTQRPPERLLRVVLTRQSGISNLYRSGPRMKGTKSDWRVNDLHFLWEGCAATI